MNNNKEILDIVDALIDKMNEKNVASLKVKTDDFEIDLLKQNEVMPIYQPPVQVETVAVKEETVSIGNEVKAPIIGTFYSSPSPNDKAFVTVGQQVKKGDVLFIIESMKVMNEVKSEFDGTVNAINLKDGEIVEFDQTVMIIA